MLLDYIALDLETTGFSPESSDIIEIGAWKVCNGVVKDKFCTYIRPYVYIPLNIQQLTGISMETVKDAPVLEEVLFDFFDWCEDLPFVAHNLKFDYSFLVAKGNNLGLDFTLQKQRKGLDTLKLSRNNLNLSSNKLEDLVNFFDIDIDTENLHSAKVDSYMLKLIMDRFNDLISNKSQLIPDFIDKDTTQYGSVTNKAVLSFE